MPLPDTSRPSNNGRPPKSDLRPYFFRRDISDVVEEAFRLVLEDRLRSVNTVTPQKCAPADEVANFEHAAFREQWAILFAHDPGMQQVFRGNFDAFCAAMEDPRLLHERLAVLYGSDGRSEHVRHESNGSSPHQQKTIDESVREWRTRWAEAARADNAGDQFNPVATLDDDPVYDRAFRWSCRVERWSRRLYYGQGVRDRDLFVVAADATLITAKVAFASSADFDENPAALETAALGYRQAALFLRRVLAALANCDAKRIGVTKTVHGLVDEGRDLLADIEARLAEIESEINSRGGWGSTSRWG
ncbi:MAG: hypothetical protein V1723_04165 [Candidatus Uhrbacteria bacterium]